MRNLLLLLLFVITVLSCKKEFTFSDINNNVNVEQRIPLYPDKCDHEGGGVTVNSLCLITTTMLSDWDDLLDFDCDTLFFHVGDYTFLGKLHKDNLHSNVKVIYGCYYPLDPDLGWESVIAGYEGSVGDNLKEFVNIKFTDDVYIKGFVAGAVYPFNFNVLCCEFDNAVLMGDDVGPYGGSIGSGDANIVASVRYIIFSSLFNGEGAGIRAGGSNIKNTVFNGNHLALSVLVGNISHPLAALYDNQLTASTYQDSCVYINCNRGIIDSLANLSAGISLHDVTYFDVYNTSFVETNLGIKYYHPSEQMRGTIQNDKFVSGVASIKREDTNSNSQVPAFYLRNSNFYNYPNNHIACTSTSSAAFLVATTNYFEVCGTNNFGTTSCLGNIHYNSNQHCYSSLTYDQTKTYHTNTTLKNWATSSF